MVKVLEKKRVVIAVGGSGGHLMPAKALAKDFLRENSQISLLFMGARLSRNAFFEASEDFKVQDVASSTFFQKNLWKTFKACFTLSKGVWQSLKYLRQFQPECVVGFGSFHSFPVLLAARIKRIPIAIFESNVLPGRVNRLCSSWAKISAVLPSVNQAFLKGSKVTVKLPFIKESENLCQNKARRAYLLKENCLTILVFGGSQGAERINKEFSSTANRLRLKKIDFQVIHIVGSKEYVEHYDQFYKKRGITASVRAFEKNMSQAWIAADFSISRSGAITVAEQIKFGTPGILIPYPYGSEDHQEMNAEFLTGQVGAGIKLFEKHLSEASLLTAIEDIINHSQEKLIEMKQNLNRYKMGMTTRSLSSVIFQEFLE